MQTFKIKKWYKFNQGCTYSLQLWTVDGYIDLIDEDNILYFIATLGMQKNGCIIIGKVTSRQLIYNRVRYCLDNFLERGKVMVAANGKTK